jgi:hypothetical protein
VLYDGQLKLGPLRKHFKGVADGSIVLGGSATEEAKQPEAEAREKDEL